METMTTLPPKKPIKKLVVLGPPNSGKSSILLALFGSVDPELILTSPIEPTIGLESSAYDWGTVRIGVFDLAGQELDTWLGDEQDNVFPETDEVFLVFDFETPQKKIIQTIKQLSPIISSNQIQYMYIFIHKIDKAGSPKEGDKYVDALQLTFDEIFGTSRLKVFGTSIYPNYYKKFQFIMDWALTALEISTSQMKTVKAVPISESLLRSMRTSGYIGVNLNEENLVELPKINPNGYNELTKLSPDRKIDEVDREEK